MAALPRFLASSVVRGSEKGQSHGGLYLVDFESQQVEQKLDWNTGDIDFSGRGWDRGLRGIEFTEDQIWIAASDELFCYSPRFELIASYRNDYLRHCHEICRRDDLLFLTSTGFDSLLAFHLQRREFVWGLYLSRDGQSWIGQPFDPLTRGGPPFANSYHLNMVTVNQDGIYLSGLNTGALLSVASDFTVASYCSLPRGCHNAQPFQGGVLFNDTQADAVRFVPREGAPIAVAVPGFDPQSLEYQGVDDSQIARQGFGRGLCIIDKQHIAAGSSPSTISVIDLAVGKRVAGVNLTLDIRNAIHGLECWPDRWT
ncbi:MAG: hypothetical protein PVJ95_01905 [Cellvibrionales bacterium]|jgi:hypothetical protein